MTATAVPSDLRARLAVSLVFVILGCTQGSWMARIPAIRDQVGLDTSALPALVLGLAVWGLSATFLNTPVNALAVAVERAHGSPLMSRFHASFSCGVLAGGAIGTLAAAGGVPPGVQLAASSTVLGALLLVLGGRLPDEEVAAERHRRSLRHRFTPQLVLLAGVAFLASFVEGAASQWSSVFTADYLHEGAALGAATYTCFTVAILVGRLVGDRFVARWGRRVFVQVSLLTIVLGAGVGLVHPGLPYALAGFTVVGLGLACVLPAVFALAGRQPEVPPGEAVSVITIGQWPGFLLAGPVVGLLAGATSLRLALASLAVAGLGAAVLTRRISMA